MARLFTSADRTRIACSTGGSGPPLVLVHGTAADSHRWERVLPGLSQRFAIHALDRRGRGASGDAPAYALAREVDRRSVCLFIRRESSRVSKSCTL